MRQTPSLQPAGSAKQRFARWWHGFQKTKLCDFLATTPLVLWYGSAAGHQIPALAENLETVDASTFGFAFIVYVLARTAGIVLTLLALILLLVRRPAKAKAKGVLPRITAIAGTYLSVAVVWLPSYPAGPTLSLISLLLIVGGVGFSIFALAHLGRSFSLMAEARRLVTDGPYAAIRHPLYLGEATSMLGLTLQYLSPLALAIMAIQFGLQLMRIKNEEQVLASLFAEYEGYRMRTARLLPGLY
jgi:protein-S-isoprenylcysteine O-methyltransferase Ste14